jgi:hypothetical protein
MAIRIPNVGTPINFGEVELKSEDWNDSLGFLSQVSINAYRQAGLNLIRQLEDKSITFSANDTEWAEAYTNIGGRLSSVDTSNTSAMFENNYYFASGTPFILTNVLETDTSTTSGGTNTLIEIDVVAHKNIIFDRVGYTRTGIGSSTVTATIIYDGNTIAQKTITSTSASSNYIFLERKDYSGFIPENEVCTIRLEASANLEWDNERSYSGTLYSYTNQRTSGRGGTGTLTVLRATEVEPKNDFIIFQNIPLDLSPRILKNFLGVPKFNVGGWEDGCSVQYKILSRTNETEHILNGTTHNPDGFTNPENFFDENSSTSASKAITAPGEASLGKIFTAKYIYDINWKFERGGSGTITYLETYNGTTWDVVANLGASDASGRTIIDSVVQGVRLRTVVTTTRTMNYFYLREIYGEAVDETPWLETNKIQSFTPFTSGPTQCLVKLIPKETSPTPGLPAINGFALMGNKNE